MAKLSDKGHEERPPSTRLQLCHDPFSLLEESDDPMHMDSLPVVIISVGLGNRKHRHWYGDEAIQSAFRVVQRDGTKMFIDHSSESEMQDRPERSVRDLAGFYYNPRITMVHDEYGKEVLAVAADLVPDSSECGWLVRSKARHAQLHKRLFPNSQVPYCGISIDGDGEQEKRKQELGDGTEATVLYVKEITMLNSADIVTLPARGGSFVQELDRIMRAATPQEASSMVKAAQVKQVKAFGALLESAVREGDEKKVNGLLAEHGAMFSALAEAEGVTFKLPKLSAAQEAEAAAEAERAAEAARKKAAGKPGEDDDDEDEKGKNKKMSAAIRDAVASAVTEAVAPLRLELKETKAQLTLQGTRRSCEAMLTEAGIPDSLLSVDDLMSVREADRPSWIEKFQKIAESQGGSGRVPARSGTTQRSDAPGTSAGFREGVRGSLGARGIPVVAAKA